MLTTILEEDTNEDVEIDEVDENSDSISSILDPYDEVYKKIPQKTHMLKPVEDCKHCFAKKFRSEERRVGKECLL